MGGPGPVTSTAASVPMGNATGDLSGMSGTFSPMAQAGGLSPQQMMLIQKALGGMPQGGGQIPNAQLDAAQAPNPQAMIGAGPTMPTVNPALHQQMMGQMLLGGQ